MTDTTSKPETPSSTSRHRIGRRLGGVGWGLFLVWAGAAFLADLGWGVALIGTAAVILLTQAARRVSGLRLERLWVAAGVVVLVVGLWELVRVPADLGPVLLIVAGGAVLLAAAFGRGVAGDGRRPSSRWCGWCHPRRARHT